ncbi:MAG: Gfo/Idh/MocA family oxidoreductase [Hyphomicrobiales bacterium]|nr:Gfo/Idh/MocA family oxidoreductase [Hyphomicrobiales bacterium]
MTANLRVAVVGSGFMGSLHARTVAECEIARLAAIVDSSEEAGRAAADAFSTEHISTVDDALSRKDIDAFIVAVPDRLHETAIPILEKGVPVLLEKPMAHDLPAAKRLAQAAEKAGAPLLVGHILRFDPRYVQAAAIVASGDIGDPIHATSGRLTVRDIGIRMNGTSSVCFYLGVHDVDLLQWLSGANVTKVFSRRVSKLMPSLGVQSEDAIFTVCEMENGLVGTLFFGWSLPSDIPTGIWSRSEVIGTKGVVDIDVRDHGLRVKDPGGWRLPDGLHWPEVNGRIAGDLREEVVHFVSAVQKQQPFVMPVDDALRAVAVNDAILRSCESGAQEAVEDWRL